MKRILWLFLFLLLVPAVPVCEAAEQEVSVFQPYTVKPGSVYKKIAANGCYFYQYSLFGSIKTDEISEVICSPEVIRALTSNGKERSDDSGGDSGGISVSGSGDDGGADIVM